MSVREQDGVRIEDGTGTVTEIERRTKNAQVILEATGLKFPVKAWLEIGDLDVIEGDTVDYEIHKGEDGYRRYVKLARSGAGEGDQSDQTSDSAVPPSVGRDDAQAGGPSPAGERDVPNSDTQRFESWSFHANYLMTRLAWGELNDAVDSGDLDEIAAPLFLAVAQHLINAADQGQRSLIGRTDRSARSHVDARLAVEDALRKHPTRAGFADLDAWATEVYRTTTRLLQVAATL